MDNTKELLAVCRKHVLSDSEGAVINEPYIPYIPDTWNGIIVLAESQNLSSGSDRYVQALMSFSANGRMNRLIPGLNGIGVQPWDDGSLKLAIEAAFDVKASETAVSNAVLWSQRGNTNQNISPDVNLQTKSSKIWTEFLDILKPNLVICSGNMADSVINNTGWTGRKEKIRLPSKTAMSRTSGMFDKDDLLARYPEVKAVVDVHPEWLSGGYEENRIFFACHVVSLNKKSK